MTSTSKTGTATKIYLQKETYIIYLKKTLTLNNILTFYLKISGQILLNSELRTIIYQ
jgi:hypothetical protein